MLDLPFAAVMARFTASEKIKFHGGKWHFVEEASLAYGDASARRSTTENVAVTQFWFGLS